jgi:hypothetical protein
VLLSLSKHGNDTLSDEDTTRLLKLHLLGRSIKDIARLMNRPAQECFIHLNKILRPSLTTQPSTSAIPSSCTTLPSVKSTTHPSHIIIRRQYQVIGPQWVALSNLLELEGVTGSTARQIVNACPASVFQAYSRDHSRQLRHHSRWQSAEKAMLLDLAQRERRNDGMVDWDAIAMKLSAYS